MQTTVEEMVYLIGKQAIEIEQLRRRVAALEQKAAEAAAASGGVT